MSEAVTNRFEVHVAAHYDPARLDFLRQVLESALSWRNCVVDAVVASNSEATRDAPFWRSLEQQFAATGGSLRLVVAGQLADPFMLTWAHKSRLPAWAETAHPERDFFVYVEDDICLTADNIEYFLRHRQTLSPTQLVPGFLRYEILDGERRLVDIMQPEYWERDRSLTIGGAMYHANINPYWAGYILDKEMALQYIDSPSFSPEKSAFVPWEIRERAAMGITFENPPARLRSRVVIPISRGMPDPGCYVWHCANNYTAQAHPVIARLGPTQAFRRESFGHYLIRKARAAPKALRRLLGIASRS